MEAFKISTKYRTSDEISIFKEKLDQCQKQLRDEIKSKNIAIKNFEILLDSNTQLQSKFR